MSETYNADDLELVQDVGLTFDCHTDDCHGSVDLGYGACSLCGTDYDIEVRVSPESDTHE